MIKIQKKSYFFLKKAINFHEDLANDEDEDDIDYLIVRIIYLENLFNDCSIENNNTDQIKEEPKINSSTFIKTPKWLALKRCVLNPNNEDNKCFQYSITLSLYYEQIG